MLDACRAEHVSYRLAQADIAAGSKISIQESEACKRNIITFGLVE
jgi:hypothetical protein